MDELEIVPDPTAPICTLCGARVHDPCRTEAEQERCQLPDFCFPGGQDDMAKFKKGGTAYVMNVGFGLTSFEKLTVAKAGKDRIEIDGLDYPFCAKTGKQIHDLPNIGLTVSLCVTDADIERATHECADE